MPLYEYECEYCNVTEEVIVRNSALRPSSLGCPVCGQDMKPKFPMASFKIDYLDIQHFGKPQYADARRKQAGVGEE